MNITRESNDASDTQIILPRREVFGFIDAEHFDILSSRSLESRIRQVVKGL